MIGDAASARALKATILRVIEDLGAWTPSQAWRFALDHFGMSSGSSADVYEALHQLTQAGRLVHVAKDGLTPEQWTLGTPAPPPAPRPRRPEARPREKTGHNASPLARPAAYDPFASQIRQG